MRSVRAFCFACLLLAATASAALAEGFALYEWSARGMALGRGLVGRADDASAIAYNAAGITQLPGTHLMGGLAFIAPMGTLDMGVSGGGSHSTTTKPKTWMAPHGYVSHQLTDDLWLGLGMFSRFGVGNSYDENWVGRYNVYDVGLQTFSFVPTLAWKINDMVSVSAGPEILYADIYIKNKIPTMFGADNDMKIKGDGWGIGAHLGLHLRFNEQWSLGLAYKSQMTLNVNGKAKFARQENNAPFAQMANIPETRDTDVEATVQLPDSLALGIAYKPLDNLSFEVGAMWTRWSTYNALNMYFDSGYNSINNKEWRDNWAFNASVEYKPLDWWALRAGIVYETSPVKEEHVDFWMPTNGRTILSLGTGFKWNNWTADLAYAHIWVNSIDYGCTDASGINNPALPGAAMGGSSKNVHANLYMFSIGYSF
ncbi:MAG: transporter [Desulfovibrio sp.]|nr:transporter [Desulfovibrio sp.]